jgi:hypothetical protein
MPMSSPQMTRMFGRSPSLTNAPPATPDPADHRLESSIGTARVTRRHPIGVIREGAPHRLVPTSDTSEMGT